MKSLFSRPSSFARKHWMQILGVAVVVSLMLVAISSLNTSKISNGLQGRITTNFQLQRLSGRVLYLNEVLTMSSRMAAATGDLAWETRYRAYEPILADVINQAKVIAPRAYDLHAEEIEAANSQLTEMEHEAFDLVRNNRPQDALAILFSDRYGDQKEIYAGGIQGWTQFLDNQVKDDLDRYRRGLFWAGVLSMTSFWMLTFAWIGLLYFINQYIRRRRLAESALRQTGYQLEINQQSLQAVNASLQQKTTALDAALIELQNAKRQLIQQEKIVGLGQLVEGVAHELNAPMSSIHTHLMPVRNQVDCLLDWAAVQQAHRPIPAPSATIAETNLSAVREDLPNRLNALEASAQHVRRIVSSLSQCSQADDVLSSSVNIHDGLESALLLLQYRLQRSAEEAAVCVVRDYDSIPAIEAYPGLLNQAFFTLLSNACDALEALGPSAGASEQQGDRNSQGQITLCTTTFTDIFGVSWVEATIADTGLSLSESAQEHIFDTFRTPQNAGRSAGRSTGREAGVGLAMSYAIVTQKHSGRLMLSSAPNTGTEFTIQLPVTLSGEPSRALPVANTQVDTTVTVNTDSVEVDIEQSAAGNSSSLGIDTDSREIDIAPSATVHTDSAEVHSETSPIGHTDSIAVNVEPSAVDAESEEASQDTPSPDKKLILGKITTDLLS